MEVIIVSKTKMKWPRVCIGGITLPYLDSVRLLDDKGNYFTQSNSSFQVGDRWDLQLKPPAIIVNPHTEDVLVTSKSKLKGTFDDFQSLVKEKKLTDRVWNGSPDIMFDELLKWTGSRNGYIAEPDVPTVSTGFWIPDKDLFFDKKHYSYKEESSLFEIDYNMAYVGFQTPKTIIANTIVRISLAKWWKPEDIDIELRCYLQLSGWYE